MSVLDLCPIPCFSMGFPAFPWGSLLFHGVPCFSMGFPPFLPTPLLHGADITTTLLSLSTVQYKYKTYVLARQSGGPLHGDEPQQTLWPKFFLLVPDPRKPFYGYAYDMRPRKYRCNDVFTEIWQQTKTNKQQSNALWSVHARWCWTVSWDRTED